MNRASSTRQRRASSPAAWDFGIKLIYSVISGCHASSTDKNIFGSEPSDYIRNCQFNGWFSEPESKILHAYDNNKHYTTCLMGDKGTFGWPVCSVLDEVKPFDGEIEAEYYYINTDNFFPFKVAG